MKLKTKVLGLETGGKPIVVLNREDAGDIGVRSMSRVKISCSGKDLTAIVDISPRLVARGIAGVSEEVKSYFNVADNAEVDIELAKLPNSLQFIINRLNGRRLNAEEMYDVVSDVVSGNLSEIEIVSFVTSLHDFSLGTDESVGLSAAMVRTGERLVLDRKVICDKHSVGGVAGDKTSLLLVPVVAAAGLTIPKTSSRAITGAAGTADRAECMMPVSLDIEEMRRVIDKTNGCMVWGGALHLAPADDIFVQVEYPLSIDPLLLPSIMSKKKAVGATHLVIDIPTGRGTKIKTIGDANFLARDFIQLGDRLGIKVNCLLTFGEQPIGYCVGPALEAREALSVIGNKTVVPDLVEKVADVAGTLLEMAGKGDGKTMAMDILRSGKAEAKLREIMSEQGGDQKLKPDDIPVGSNTHGIVSEKEGSVLWLNNHDVIAVARAAGAPKDRGAGIVLHKKLGDRVKKGEKLLDIYAEKPIKLERAIKTFEELEMIGVGEKREMLIHRVEEIRVHGKSFIMER